MAPMPAMTTHTIMHTRMITRMHTIMVIVIRNLTTKRVLTRLTSWVTRDVRGACCSHLR